MPDENGFATPEEQQAAEAARFNAEQRERDAAARAAVTLNGAPAGWFERAAPEVQANLIKAGYTPDVNPPLAPGELRQVEKIDPFSKSVSYEYLGDSAAVESWMGLFKNPVRQVALHVRAPSESDEWHANRSKDRLEAFQEYCAASGKVWVP